MRSHQKCPDVRKRALQNLVGLKSIVSSCIEEFPSKKRTIREILYSFRGQQLLKLRYALRMARLE
jgi:hypothetical protein